jgi:hypothetical protein
MKRIEFVPLVAASLMAASPQKMPHIVTYRDAGCGCCEGWLNAARAAGYPVELHDLDRAERLRRFRLSDATAGCHTSLTDGYIIEGHVPLNIVARLLRERPRIRGIAFPGMPSGVPGMDGPRAGGSDILTLEPRPQVYARV